MTRVHGQNSCRELPAAGDQGLGTWIRNEPIGRTSDPGRGGLLVGGLDFRYHSRHEAHGLEE
jgi:hypothetical protein